MTELTAEGMAATRITTARCYSRSDSSQEHCDPSEDETSAHSYVTTPSVASGAVLANWQKKLIVSPSTKLARGVVVRCNGVKQTDQ